MATKEELKEILSKMPDAKSLEDLAFYLKQQFPNRKNTASIKLMEWAKNIKELNEKYSKI